MEIRKLFEPITIKKLTIKNRIVMPSMGLAYSTNFSFNDRLWAFFMVSPSQCSTPWRVCRSLG